MADGGVSECSKLCTRWNSANNDECQRDIPHLIDKLLTERCSPASLSKVPGSTTYENANCSFSSSTGVIDYVALCKPPSRLNSGSHRVIIGGLYKGGSFITVIEEIENFVPCAPLGENLYIGIDNPTVVRSDPLGFIDFLVRSTTGLGFYLNTQVRIHNSAEIKIYLRPLERMKHEVSKQQCKLTPMASRCFLYSEGYQEFWQSYSNSTPDVTLRPHGKVCRPYAGGGLHR